MAIYDFSQQAQEEVPLSCYPDEESASFTPSQQSDKKKGRWFSALVSRLFFLVLLVADLLWLGYTLCVSSVFLIAIAFTGGRVEKLRQWQSRKWLALRRSIVCAVALLVALFSPSFGVMVACTYFLMYDKAGIAEVVPSALQSELQTFMK